MTEYLEHTTIVDPRHTASSKERRSTGNEVFLGASLKQRVQQRCFRRVDQLEVELHDGRVVVSGRVPSYYLLQIVQSVVCEVFSSENLDFQVVVGSSIATDDL